MPLVLGAVVLCLLTLPAAGLAQPGQDDPPPPPAEPAPVPEPPIVELPAPEGRTAITLKVPPLPEEKKSQPKAATPKPDPDPAPAAAPARRASTPPPEPAYTPEPEAAYSPAYEPEPAAATATRKATQKPKPEARPKVRKPKRQQTAPARAVEAIEPALPVVTIVEDRRSFAAALPQPSYAPEDGGSTPLYLLFPLALAGTLLLGLACAAPRLAFYWPQVFVPVIRERDAVSFFGLCLLASGMLAWAIVGTGL